MSLGIQTSDPSSDADAGSFAELTAAGVHLEAGISELTETLAAHDEWLAARDARMSRMSR